MGMQPDQQGVFFQLVIQGGGEFTYDASGNLRSANVGQVTTDPLQGITCQQGFSTFNGFGAVINLLSTSLGAFFQYQDLGTSSQGSLVLAVASTGGTDPVTSHSYIAALNGIDPVFGDVIQVTGSLIAIGTPAMTRLAEIQPQSASDSAHSPYLRIDAPEQTTAEHVQMLIEGASPDGTTRPWGQALIGVVSGSGILAAASTATLEVQQAAAGIIAIRAAGPIQTTDSVLLANNASPPGVGNAATLYATGNTPTQVRASGLSGQIPATQTDATTFTVTAAASAQASKAWSIPAADANVGTWYRLTVLGFGTEGSTAQTLQISAALNGAAIKSATMPTITANLAFRFRCVIDFHVKTTGAGGTMEVTGQGIYGGGSPAVNGEGVLGSTAAGGEAINTTIANTVQLNVNWGSTTGAPTITTFASLFERIGP